MWPFKNKPIFALPLLPGEHLSAVQEISQPVAAILKAMDDRPDDFIFTYPSALGLYCSETTVSDRITEVKFSIYMQLSVCSLEQRLIRSDAPWISPNEAEIIIEKVRCIKARERLAAGNSERARICALYNVTPPQTPDNQPKD